MMESFAKSILRGGIQRYGRGNLANTYLKLVLVLLPFSLGAWYLFWRFLGLEVQRHELEVGLTLLMGIVIAQTVDLRPLERGRLVRWTLLALGVQVAVVLFAVGILDMDSVVKVMMNIPGVRWLSRLGDFEDLVILAFFAVGGRGVLALTATDAFILSGIFAWTPRLRVLYEACIVSYFTVYHSLARLLRQAWLVARSRYRLLRGDRSWLMSIVGWAGLFMKTLLTGLGEKAELTESILTERQWYARTLRNPVVGGWNPEDSVAIVVLGFFVILAVML